MSNVEGRVRQIYDNISKAGNPYWTIIVDTQNGGVKGSVFDRPNISIGDEVIAEYTQKDQYINWAKFEVKSPPKPPTTNSGTNLPTTTQATPTQANYSRFNPEESQRIVRQSSLASASRIIANLISLKKITTTDDATQAVIMLADRLSAYAWTGEDICLIMEGMGTSEPTPEKPVATESATPENPPF